MDMARVKMEKAKTRAKNHVISLQRPTEDVTKVNTVLDIIDY
jgi:hypothetical protein